MLFYIIFAQLQPWPMQSLNIPSASSSLKRATSASWPKLRNGCFLYSNKYDMSRSIIYCGSWSNIVEGLRIPSRHESSPLNLLATKNSGTPWAVNGTAGVARGVKPMWEVTIDEHEKPSYHVACHCHGAIYIYMCTFLMSCMQLTHVNMSHDVVHGIQRYLCLRMADSFPWALEKKAAAFDDTWKTSSDTWRQTPDQGCNLSILDNCKTIQNKYHSITCL